MFLKNARRKLIIGLRHLSSKKSPSSDHYETLQVPRSATQAEIKNAYFELSKQYHPDRVKATEENVKKFRNITEAYEVLGNVDNRRVYDRGGMSDSDLGGTPYPEKEEEDDPYKRFYDKRTHEVGATFDAWTYQQQHKLRRKKAEMKAIHESFHERMRETEDQNMDVFIAFVAMFFIGVFVYYKISSVPSSSNVKEHTLKNNSSKSDKDKR